LGVNLSGNNSSFFVQVSSHLDSFCSSLSIKSCVVKSLSGSLICTCSSGIKGSLCGSDEPFFGGNGGSGGLSSSCFSITLGLTFGIGDVFINLCLHFVDFISLTHELIVQLLSSGFESFNFCHLFCSKCNWGFSFCLFSFDVSDLKRLSVLIVVLEIKIG
jgi:hypothetical protein